MEPSAVRAPAGPLRAALYSVPAWLSLWAIAAHFLRDGALLFAAVALFLPALLFVRHVAATRALQVALVLGALSWLLTASEIAQERQLLQRPYTRMLVILGGVALLDLFAAGLLEAPSMRRRRRLPQD